MAQVLDKQLNVANDSASTLLMRAYLPVKTYHSVKILTKSSFGSSSTFFGCFSACLVDCMIARVLLSQNLGVGPY